MVKGSKEENKKKIIICGNDKEGQAVGGPDIWILRICLKFRKQEFEVIPCIFYFGLKNKCNQIKKLGSNGFKVLTIAYKEYPTTEKQIQVFSNYVMGVRPDVIISNHIASVWYANKYIKPANIPMIGVLHSNSSPYFGLIEEFAWKKNIFSLDNIVAVSQHMKELTLKKGNTKVDVISCGTKVPSFTATPPNSTLRVVYIGRFRHLAKRIFELTEAFCLGANNVKDTEYFLYGYGPDNEEREMLDIIKRNHCESKVHIKGQIPHENIHNEISDKHVVVLMSEYEGLPMALIEAMSVGLVPVCLYEPSGIGEIVKNGENGIIIQDRNKSFVKAIHELKSDKNKWQDFSFKARQTVIQNYSDEIEDQKWIDLVTKLVKENEPKYEKLRTPLKVKLPKKNAFITEDVRGEKSLVWYKQLRKDIGLRTRIKKLWLNL